MAIKSTATTPLDLGKEVRVFSESPTASGSNSETFAVDSESVQVSFYVTNTSGDINLKVYTYGKDGQETEVITFPTVSAPTSNLLIRRAGAVMQKIRIEVTYTDACEFEVRARGVTAGAASVNIVGSSNFEVTRTSVTTTPVVLIAAALDDRNGILVENINDLSSGSEVLYVAETLAKATTGAGHPVRPGGNVSIDLQAGASLFAVADSGTIAVSIIESGGD